MNKACCVRDSVIAVAALLNAFEAATSRSVLYQAIVLHG